MHTTTTNTRTVEQSRLDQHLRHVRADIVDGAILGLAHAAMVAFAIYLQVQPFGQYFVDMRQEQLYVLSTVIIAISTLVLWVTTLDRKPLARETAIALATMYMFAAAITILWPSKGMILASWHPYDIRMVIASGFAFAGMGCLKISRSPGR